MKTLRSILIAALLPCLGLTAWADEYVITDMTVETILIGNVPKRVGSVFSLKDTISWPIANCKLWAVKKDEARKKGKPKTWLFSNISRKASSGVASAFKYNDMGSRGGQNDNGRVYRLKKGKTLRILTRWEARQNMYAETVLSRGQEQIVMPLKRSDDGRYYELTDQLFGGFEPLDVFTLTIRECSSAIDDRNTTDYVYQDLVIFYVP